MFDFSGNEMCIYLWTVGSLAGNGRVDGEMVYLPSQGGSEQAL